MNSLGNSKVWVLFLIAVLLFGWRAEASAATLQASYSWHSLEPERVREISRLASKVSQQELFINEFSAFLRLYANELKGGLSPEDQRLIGQLLEELKSQSDRIVDVSVYSLFSDSKLETHQNSVGILQRNFNFSRGVEDKIGLSEFKVELKKFLEVHREDFVVGLGGQKEVVRKCAIVLHERESCRHILSEYCVFCLARHGLGRLLRDPTFYVQGGFSEVNLDAAVDVLVSDCQLEDVTNKLKLAIKEYHISFLQLLTIEQQAVIARRAGLSPKLLLEVELGAASAHGYYRFDSYVDSLELSGTFRKPSVARLPPKTREMILKDFENRESKDETQADAVFHVMEIKNVIDHLSHEEFVSYSNLFFQSYRGGWSYLNPISHGNFVDATELQGVELSAQQSIKIRSLYLEWYKDIGKNKDYDSVVEANNALFREMGEVLFPAQAPGVFIEGVASNGGLASFVLRPGVSSELKITLHQKDLIRKLRKRSHGKISDLDLLLRHKILRKVLGKLDNDFSAGLLRSVKDGAWREVVRNAELRNFVSPTLPFNNCRNQNVAPVGAMEFDKEFVDAFFGYLESRN